MNGCGKSDRSIVPGMLSNKACESMQAAEKAEGRDLTKEIPLQQNKFRTQCRGGIGYRGNSHMRHYKWVCPAARHPWP